MGRLKDLLAYDDAHNVGWSEAGGTPSFPSMAVTAPMPLPRRIENPPLRPAALLHVR